jgi:hypothetical protein
VTASIGGDGLGGAIRTSSVRSSPVDRKSLSSGPTGGQRTCGHWSARHLVCERGACPPIVSRTNLNPGETTKTITIEVKGDSKKEANETFNLDLLGNSINSLFTKSRGLGTILNDD